MIVRLGDIATYVNGYAFKPSDWSDTGLPIIRIQDLTGNAYQANRYNGKYDKRYEVNAGDILISWSASLGVYVWHGEKSVLNQHIFKVVFDKAEVNKSFFLYQVQNILENAASQAHGATMKHLTKPTFDALPFYLPAMSDQRSIASILDKVSNSIFLRKQQLAKLDELIKARFVEMFGDPVLNPQKWPQKRFDSICENLDSQRIPITASDRKQGIYPYYGASGIVDYVDDYIFDEDILLISEDGANLIARVTPIAFSVSGKVWVNNHAHVVRFKERCTQTYVEHYFALIDISDCITGTAQPKLNQAKLNAIMVPIPDLTLQDHFYTFIKRVAQQELTIQQSLDKLEVLKKSLMQEYFG